MYTLSAPLKQLSVLTVEKKDKLGQGLRRQVLSGAPVSFAVGLVVTLLVVFHSAASLATMCVMSAVNVSIKLENQVSDRDH